jgi:hypothetical protein
MKSQVVKRSVVVAGHKTSVSLEDAFWIGLKEISGERHMTLSELVAAIDSQRQHGKIRAARCETEISAHGARSRPPRCRGCPSSHLENLIFNSRFSRAVGFLLDNIDRGTP